MTLSELLYIYHFSYQLFCPFDHFMLKSTLKINELLLLLLVVVLELMVFIHVIFQ